MNEKEFNLIDQPWIKVRTPSLKVETVSLRDALLHAHEYVDLAGELPTQDAAVLRLLLAVLHAVFSRVDAQGRPDPLKTAGQGLKRWKELWEGKQLPEKPLDDYFSQWHERFWLFHPERPFYQVDGIDGTQGNIPKFNGELSQSDNKPRLFSHISGKNLKEMSYSDAARWLLYLNGFADIAVAPDKRKNLGVGWMGSLGLVIAIGNNLFETLLLNLVLLKGRDGPWKRSMPTWELEEVRREDRSLIPLPDNQAELLSLQSRRILLRREKGAVIGYIVSGGDYFVSANSFVEQMTLWKADKKGDFFPLKPKSGVQAWREFSAIAGLSESRKRPGVVDWTMLTSSIAKLQRIARFQICCVYFDSKNSVVDDILNDGLSFHVSLLSEAGQIWRQIVENEVSRIEKLASAVGSLAGDLEKAVGHVEKDKKGNVIHSLSMMIAGKAQELFYHRIDVPFRLWLRKLDPSQGDAVRIELQQEWIETARKTVLDLGQELVKQRGDAALLGRYIKVKIKKEEKKVHYSAPEVSKRFQIEVEKICKEG